MIFRHTGSTHHPIFISNFIVAESKSMDVDETLAEGGLVISDVSEFVSNLSANVIQPPAAPAPKVVSRAQSVSVDEDTSVETQDHAQDESRNGASKEGVSEDASDEDINMSRSRTRAESEEQEDVEMEEETKESAAIVSYLARCPDYF